MVALDRLPFKTIADSAVIKRGLIALGYTDPSSDFAVRSAVKQYAEEVKMSLRVLLAEKREKGFRFSVTTDEYTSGRNRRYCCINVHLPDGKHLSIGMVRVEGSLPAERAARLLQDQLRAFDIVLERDVIAITTDGVSVMKKMGRIVCTVHQLCHAHGLHLAVCDVLYKVIPEADVEEDVQVDAAVEEEEVGEEEDEGQTEEEGPTEEEQDEVGGWAEEEEVPEGEFTTNISDVIKAVRKIVRLFLKSPVKNDLLQKYAVQDLEKQLILIIDCKTRWSFLLAMLKRFLTMKVVVQKALIDLNKSSIFPSETDLTTVADLVGALDVVECGTAELWALCRRDATLASADQIFEYMLQALKAQKTQVSKTLFKSVEERIGERRLACLSTLQAYLENSLFLDNQTEMTLQKLLEICFLDSSLLKMKLRTWMRTGMQKMRVDQLLQRGQDIRI
jgi:hypothetical protein